MKICKLLFQKEGIANPFKRRGKTILVPPFEYVYKTLQPKAAYYGMEDPAVYKYCLRLYEFAKKAIPKDRYTLLNPLVTMLNERKTTSDEIIKKAKLVGYKKGKVLTNSQAAKLAILLSKDIHKDILNTKQHLRLLRR